MADRNQDHPSQRTFSARFDRVFGRDRNGRSGLGIFFSEATSSFVGSDGETFFGRGALLAAATIVGGIGYAGLTDLNIPANGNVTGKFNLINGYSVIEVQGEKIALIRERTNGEDRFGVYLVTNATSDLLDEWRLVSDPDQAKSYATMVRDYLLTSVAEQSHIKTNEDGTTQYGIGAYYAPQMSVAYRNVSDDNAGTIDDTSVYVDMDIVPVDLPPSQFTSYTEQTAALWSTAIDSLPATAAYGPAEPLQLNDDYYFWGQVTEGGSAALGGGLAGWALLAGLGGIARTRRRVSGFKP